MAVTRQQVLIHLRPDEPDYRTAARTLGSDAIPLLLELVEAGDPELASKATFLASLIPSESSLAVLQAASRSSNDLVRVSAANSLRNLPEVTETLVDQLLADGDFGVRKVTVESIAERSEPALRTRIEHIARSDPDDLLREISNEILRARGDG